MEATVWHRTAIEGVLRRSTTIVADSRGSFAELWRSSWTEQAGHGPLAQANLSRSDAGVVRGLHFHLRQTDLWVVLEGLAHVVLVDLRVLLAGGNGPPPTVTLELSAGGQVVIPVGVAHGFRALEPVTLLYLVTNEYDGTDEHGFAWDDPAAGASWPAGTPTLSDRDARAPSLAEAIARARQGQSSAR